MDNYFDQFDGSPALAQSANVPNFFDQYDSKPLNFERDDKAIRADIAQLPETEKKEAYDKWADHKVAKERAAGLYRLPSAATGIPIIGGYLDEATAFIQDKISDLTDGNFGEPYDEALALERSRQRQANAANPATAAVTQIATGLATGGPLLSRIPVAATAVGKIGQGGVLGYGLGAAEGFSRGEGSFEDRLENADEQGKSAAAFGAVLPAGSALVTKAAGTAAGRAVRDGAGRVGDSVAALAARYRSGPEEAADVILQRRIAREGSTPAQKRLDLQRGQAVDSRMNSNSNATLPETIADTSDSMRRLTGSVYRTGAEAGEFTAQQLNRRQRGLDNPFARERPVGPQGQQERIMDATERAMLIRSSDTARRTDAAIMRQQAIDGRRLYDEARANSEAFDIQPVLDSFVTRVRYEYPAPVAARLQRAANLFTRPAAQGANRASVDNVALFDASKKSLDDMIESAQRAGQGNLARELTGFKNDLLGAVHAGGRNARYAEARATWGSAAENREAIELGRAALRQNSEVSVDQFRELSQGQQQLFRIGFLESMRNALATKRPGNDITQLFQQTRVRELMSEIIPSSRGGNTVFNNRPERFGNVLRREQRMVQTRNEVLGNSKTAQREGDDMEFAGDALSGMWNRFRQSPSLFNMGIEAVGVGIQKVFGYRQDVALALARRLLETDPTVRNQILRRLQQRGGPGRAAQFADMIDQTNQTLIGVGAGVGSEPAQVEAR